MGYFFTSTTLKLRLSYTDIFTKEKSCKESLVGSGSPKNLKMIFILLAEVVAVHVQFTIIYIRYLSFKGSFALFWRLTRSLVGLQVSLHKSFEQFIGRRRSGNQSPRDSRGMKRSIAAFGGGSWWIAYKLIFTAWRKVTARTAASA